MSWVQEWVPVRLRGKYFGRRNRLLQVSQIVFLVLSGWLLGKLAGSVLAFQILLGGAVLMRIGSVMFQRQIQAESPINDRAEVKLSWREQGAILLATKPFLWLVSYGAAWGFAASTFGPFYAVFMYKELGLSVQDVSTIVILSSVGAAVAAPAWGALADRFGNKPVMLFCMIVWQVQNFLWCVLTPANSWMLYGMWIYGGVMATGFMLALFNLQLKIIPSQAKTLAISANLAITSLVTAMGPIVGGGVLEHLLRKGGATIDVYHRVFLVLPVMGLLACLLLTRVHERAASPLSSVVGAMRNIRTLGGVFGLSILVDYVFIKPQRTPKPRQRIKNQKA
jgi:Na+/melibiose symporter-like transporter